MTEPITQWIAALRDELQHYGELLVLLEQQRGCVADQAGEELARSVATVQTQAHLLRNARLHRETLECAVAGALGLNEAASFAEIQSRLPAVYRPLAEALMQENHDLLARVKQTARQNHLLLSRSLELMQRFLNTLFPPRAGRSFRRRCRHREPATDPPLVAPPLFDAVG